MFENAFGYNQKIPEHIREIFMWLCQDVVSINEKWNFYLGLFSNQENTKLLSYVALNSFNIIEESLRTDLLMAICRLCDPIQSCGYDNLSIETLIKQCGSITDITKLYQEFYNECNPFREWRNKRFGHNDLNTTINPSDYLLPNIKREQIDSVIYYAIKILNTVCCYYDRDLELSFERKSVGGASDLLYWLKLGKEYQGSQKLVIKRDKP